MNRIYYVLPADYCADALARFQIARDDAVAAKHELMQKYGCVALLRRGAHIDGLLFKEYTDLSGFTVPRRRDDLWLVKPKKTTLRGRRVQAELDQCGELLEIWQWALEKCLGVHGCVLDREGFHNLVAHPLKDGRVLLDAPDGKNRPRGPNVSRNFDDPVIPDCAVKIGVEEALRILLEIEEQGQT